MMSAAMAPVALTFVVMLPVLVKFADVEPYSWTPSAPAVVMAALLTTPTLPPQLASTPTVPAAGVTLVGALSPRIRVRSATGTKLPPGRFVKAPSQDTVLVATSVVQVPARASPLPDNASTVIEMASAARIARVVGARWKVRVMRVLFERPFARPFISFILVVQLLMVARLPRSRLVGCLDGL